MFLPLEHAGTDKASCLVQYVDSDPVVPLVQIDNGLSGNVYGESAAVTCGLIYFE